MLPQHWVQEAGDKQTWIRNFAHKCVLNWRGGKKTVPFNLTTNTPTFFTPPSSYTYPAFVLTFEALEAPYFCRETVLKFPDCRYTDNKPTLVPEEFDLEENINFCKDVSVDERVNADNKMEKNPTYCHLIKTRIPQRLFDKGPSPPTCHLHSRKEKTSSLLRSTIRSSSCNGTMALAI